MIQERQVSWYFSSAEENGAVKLNQLGNKFQVQLLEPILIPSSTLYATVEVVGANIWNTSPNISIFFNNNHFYVSYGAISENIEIPDGLYGITELEGFLQREFLNRGLPEDLLQLSANDATQKTVITFNYVGVSVDFTPNDTCRDVLGFNSQVITSTAIGESVEGDVVAGFNRVESYFIKSNLVQSGVPNNKFGSGIIAGVPITAKVGSLIIYQPFNPVRSVADELIGQPKQNLVFTLVDQEERDISTAEENWSFTIVIRYWVDEARIKQTQTRRVQGSNPANESAYF